MGGLRKIPGTFRLSLAVFELLMNRILLATKTMFREVRYME